LLASIDKALKASTGNKMLKEKLTYEREMFVSQRFVPTAVPTMGYLKSRSQAISALEAAYQPAIKELVKAKKDDDAEAVEAALSDLLKAARGYGLGIPDLAGRPALLLENKATGTVIEPSTKEGYGDMLLVTKAAKKKALQTWHLDREEKGYV